MLFLKNIIEDIIFYSGGAGERNRTLACQSLTLLPQGGFAPYDVTLLPLKNIIEDISFNQYLLINSVSINNLILERASGIEPPPLAWEANVLPLNYARV